MLKRAIVALAFMGGLALAPFSARPASAWADTPDAGVTVDVGSAVLEQPAAAAPAAPECTYKGEAIDCAALGQKFADAPAEAVSTVSSMWKGGAIVPAVILGLFAVMSLAAKRFPWLTKDHRAAYTASGLSMLTILAEPASRGTTPTLSMLVTAIGAAVLLFVNAKKPAETTASGTIS